MSSQSVADELIARLHTWGVTRLFGYSGDGINPILGALRRSESGMNFVQARHEENAAFMAVAHSKYGLGQYADEHAADQNAGVDLGVMLATQGPGAVHLLNGLYDAKLDSMPVLAIVGQQNTTALGSGYQQELDLEAMFKDVAVYCEQIAAPEQLHLVLDRAIRTALASSGPAVVIVPHDVQQAEAAQPGTAHAQIPTAVVWEAPLVVPREPELKQAVKLLNESEKIVMLVGQGARGATKEVHSVAQLLDAGIVTSLLGKPYVDESWPQAAGVMGHLGSTASAALLEACDLLLIVGSNDPWTEFYPPGARAKAIQIDINARRPGNRYPVDVALVADAAHTLRALEERLSPAQKRRKPWRDQVRAEVAKWRSVAARRALTPARPINPERVVHELSALIPPEAQVAVDVGSCVYWYARQLRLPPGVPAHLCSTLASMGAGVPYGLAAKLRDPRRPTVVLAGDGAMQMSGNAELVTLSELWKEWEDPRFIICVFNNRDLAEVSWEQRETEGEPRFRPSQDLPGFPFAEYAQMLGLSALSISNPDSIADAWEQALACDRPMLLEMHTDPNVPLLSPFPQGERTLENMRKGLKAEGQAGERALQLLEVYADMESTGKNSS